MTTYTVEFALAGGYHEALWCDVFPTGGGAAIASDRQCSDVTTGNKGGVYQFTFESTETGLHYVAVKAASGSENAWTTWPIRLQDTADVQYPLQTDKLNVSGLATDVVTNRIAAICIGDVTGAGTGTEVFEYGGVTATVSADSDGNRTIVWS